MCTWARYWTSKTARHLAWQPPPWMYVWITVSGLLNVLKCEDMLTVSMFPVYMLADLVHLEFCFKTLLFIVTIKKSSRTAGVIMHFLSAQDCIDSSESFFFMIAAICIFQSKSSTPKHLWKTQITSFFTAVQQIISYIPYIKADSEFCL